MDGGANKKISALHRTHGIALEIATSLLNTGGMAMMLQSDFTEESEYGECKYSFGQFLASRMRRSPGALAVTSALEAACTEAWMMTVETILQKPCEETHAMWPPVSNALAHSLQNISVIWNRLEGRGKSSMISNVGGRKELDKHRPTGGKQSETVLRQMLTYCGSKAPNLVTPIYDSRVTAGRKASWADIIGRSASGVWDAGARLSEQRLWRSFGSHTAIMLDASSTTDVLGIFVDQIATPSCVHASAVHLVLPAIFSVLACVPANAASANAAGDLVSLCALKVLENARELLEMPQDSDRNRLHDTKTARRMIRRLLVPQLKQLHQESVMCLFNVAKPALAALQGGICAEDMRVALERAVACRVDAIGSLTIGHLREQTRRVTAPVHSMECFVNDIFGMDGKSQVGVICVKGTKRQRADGPSVNVDINSLSHAGSRTFAFTKEQHDATVAAMNTLTQKWLDIRDATITASERKQRSNGTRNVEIWGRFALFNENDCTRLSVDRWHLRKYRARYHNAPFGSKPIVANPPTRVTRMQLLSQMAISQDKTLADQLVSAWAQDGDDVLEDWVSSVVPAN